MQQRHGWPLNIVEAMIPWERDIYAGMIMNKLEEDNKNLPQSEDF